MRTSSRTPRGILAVAAVFLLAGGGKADESLLERNVLPVLTKQCLGCHGGLRQKGGLDLRTVPSMLRPPSKPPGSRKKKHESAWQA